MIEQDRRTEAACDKIAQYHFDFNSPRQCHSHHLLSRQIRRAVSAGKAEGRAEALAEALEVFEIYPPHALKREIAALQTKPLENDLEAEWQNDLAELKRKHLAKGKT